MGRDFLIFYFAFILFVIVGTITHELGHLVVAESLGYKSTLHYDSINYDNSELNNELDSLYIQNRNAIEAKQYFNDKEMYDQKLQKLNYDSFLVLIGGPLQTILTGTIGLLFIFIRFKKYKSEFRLIDWLSVFLSLFWLREVYVLIQSFIYEIIFKEGSYFGGDEKYIAEYFDLPSAVFPFTMAIIGMVISIYIVFFYIPKRFRSTFIISGFFGGISGIALWYLILGPLVLP